MTYPIEDFLNVRSAMAAGFSPDGSNVLVAANLSGTMQLYSVACGGGDPTPITDFAEPVSGRYLPSGEILLQMDSGGNERLQIYRIEGDGTNVRPVVYEPEYIHRVGSVSRDGKTLSYASNRRNGVDFDICVLELASGDDQIVASLGGWLYSGEFSPDARFLSIGRLGERAGDNASHIVDLVSGEIVEVAPHDEPSAIGTAEWLPDGSGFFFSTDQDREFAAIAFYDMRARTWRPVIERDADLACSIDKVGRALAVTTTRDGYTSVEFFDPATLERVGELPLPRRGVVPTLTRSDDGRLVAYTFMSPVDAGDAWLYDLDSQETRRLTDVPKPVPADALVEPVVERFASFDGEEISALVFRPAAGVDAPVVVSIHGGPESQYIPVFNPVTQFLVARGYGVVAPNVRGSTGYGKRFQHLDDGRLRLDSVADLAALHGWLVAQPGLDAARAALMGGSYGGYMTLAGLAFQPSLWAAGVDIVGISSLVTFLENTAAWRRKFREREYGSLEHDRDFLVEASPITRVDDMRAPLFIIHGANDPRVPVGEAEQIHRVLSAKGVPCELLVYADEGHGLAKLKNRLDAYPKAADFLDRVLG